MTAVLRSMLPGIGKSSFLSITALLIGFLFVFTAHAAEQDTKKVFVLNSFNRGYIWTDNMLRGIDDAFGKSGVKVETYVTFMDMKRIPSTPQYLSQLKDLIREGYKGIRFDAVLSCDNDALEFLRKYRDELFPGVPVVFSSINDYDERMLDGRKDITGTSENTPYAETIRCALKLRPGTKNIVVVVDNTTTGKAHRSAVEKVRGSFPQNITFFYLSLSEMTLEELAGKLSTLSDDSVVLLLQHFVDRNGTAYTVQQSTPLLAQSSSVPVFVMTDIRVGLGAFGGVVVSGYHHGEAAAQMVVKILNGVDAGTIPVLLDSPNKYMFDYNVMQRFGIAESSLPPGSILINKPVSLLDQYKPQLYAVFASFFILSGILIFLLLEVGKRKRVEAALLDRRLFVESLLNSSPDVIYIYDLIARQNVYSNNGINTVLGYSIDEIQKMGEQVIPILMHPVDYKEYLEKTIPKYTKVKDNELISHGYRMKHKSGNWSWLESRELIYKRQADGSPQQIFGVIRDITERKLAEEREKELREKLERAGRLESLGVLAGGVAHDLNNVLGPMVILPEMVAEYIARLGNPADPEHADTLEAMQTIAASAMRASAMVSDLVVMGRRGQFQQSPVDINKMVANLMDSKQVKELQSRRPDVRLAKQLSEESLWCLGSDSRLARVLVNLVGNAVEAIDGQGDVVVRTARQVLTELVHRYEDVPAGDYVTIEVVDTGCGMDVKTLSRMFEPFYSTKAPSKRSGSGLGLSVVNGLVKDHAGFLDVESEQGKGTTFTVYLQSAAAGEVVALTERENLPGGHERILVVDDEPGQQVTVRRQLSRLGYAVTVVDSGEEAVALFKAGGKIALFDLVLMDMIMKGMDGLAACKAILNLFPKQKILIVSGYAPDNLAEEVKALGIAWLAKPYKAREFACALRAELDKGQTQKV